MLLDDELLLVLRISLGEEREGINIGFWGAGWSKHILPLGLTKERLVMTLTQDINDAAGKGPAGLEEADRLALLQATEKLSLALENPLEKSIRLFFVRGIFFTSGQS